MPVNQKHREYKQHISVWAKCRDVLKGEEAIKAAGTAYLPALSKQTSEEYQSYKNRGMFYNATARTIEGLVGAVMRKEPNIEMLNQDITFLDTIGDSEQSIYQISSDVLGELLGLGRVGLLVDSARSEEEGDDPYITTYHTESIINWRYQTINGRQKLVMVVLHEEVEDFNNAEDVFDAPMVEQYRVLRMDEGVYTVQLWRKMKSPTGKEEFIMIDEFQPRVRGGRRLDFIPFWMPVTLERPPVLDLVNVNLSHYRNSVDLEHGRHFTALPTAWVAGFKPPKGGAFHIGSQVAWVTDEPSARAGYLEFTGAGLGHLSEALEEKERLMAVLGARLLEQQQNDAEAFATVKLRHSGEDGVLATVADLASEGITQALKWWHIWTGSTAVDKITYALNQDFNALQIDPQLLTALMGAMQGGGISYDTFWYNLQRGELTPPGRTVEEEIELISAGIPLQGTIPFEEEDEQEEDTPPALSQTG